MVKIFIFSTAGHPQNDRSSWMTADSGCCSSSSGERSPSTSMGQVYCPSTVPEYPPEETTISGHQYATPYVTSSSRNRCMSESASSNLQGRVHRRSDSEASSQSSYYSGGSDVTSIVSSDSGYFGQGHHPHPEWHKENSAPTSISPPKQRNAFNRSQSVSGRPNAAQAAQLAVLASHAARSRSAPMPPVRKSSVPPPCPERFASLLSEEQANEDALDENGEPSILLKQIQIQRQAIKSKSKSNPGAVNQSWSSIWDYKFLLISGQPRSPIMWAVLELFYMDQEIMWFLMYQCGTHRQLCNVNIALKLDISSQTSNVDTLDVTWMPRWLEFLSLLDYPLWKDLVQLRWHCIN